MIFTLVLILSAQQFEHQRECGDPVMESMAWRVLTGTVVAVEPNGDLRLDNVEESFRLTTPRTVGLVDVELALPDAQLALRKLIGKRVDVWINGKAIDDARVTGAVHRGKEDVNRTLLSRGLGRYVDPPAYSISHYTTCLHRIAEREAREAHRGLWK